MLFMVTRINKTVLNCTNFRAAGLSFEGVRKKLHDPPPPPYDDKSEHLPQQLPLESTVLHQLAAINLETSPQELPNMRLALLNAKYQFKQNFVGGLFQKYPSDPKFDPPPLQKFLGTGLVNNCFRTYDVSTCYHKS